MRRLMTALIACTLALGVWTPARGQEGLFVVISDETGRRGGFQPMDHAVDVSSTVARVAVALMRKDVRLADGKIVTGFGFDGWTQGDGVQVVVSSLLPADGTNRYVEVARGTRPSFRKQEFARLVLKPGEKRAIDEMKALGIEPMVLQLDTKPPFVEQRQ
jgi:hypothetical protein